MRTVCLRLLPDSVVAAISTWRPEFELVGISSGSWYHCLPIRTYYETYYEYDYERKVVQ